MPSFKNEFSFAVLISGSGSNLQAVLDAIENGIIPGARIELVISDREDAYGLERAENRDIANLVIDKNDTSGLLKLLNPKSIDGIILAGYLSILPPEVIEKYSGKIINIHPALLPMFGGKGFYGIRVHKAVLASGVSYTGATAHIVDNGIDTGPAIVRGVVPVLAGDTAEELQKRVLAIEHKVLVTAVKAMVENKLEEMTAKPLVYIDEPDREGVLKFAGGLVGLGSELMNKGNGE